MVQNKMLMNIKASETHVRDNAVRGVHYQELLDDGIDDVSAQFGHSVVLPQEPLTALKMIKSQ